MPAVVRLSRSLGYTHQDVFPGRKCFGFIATNVGSYARQCLQRRAGILAAAILVDPALIWQVVVNPRCHSLAAEKTGVLDLPAVRRNGCAARIAWLLDAAFGIASRTH